MNFSVLPGVLPLFSKDTALYSLFPYVGMVAEYSAKFAKLMSYNASLIDTCNTFADPKTTAQMFPLSFPLPVAADLGLTGKR